MDEDDELGEPEVHPELAGYEPHDRARRSRRSTTIRVVVIVGLLSLILPGILVTIYTADRTAQYSCAAYTQYYAPDAVGSVARFDLIGPSIGWNCYAQFFGGSEIVIATLGLIPGGRPLPSQPLEQS